MLNGSPDGYNLLHVTAADIGGGLATLLGHHGIIQIRLFRNGDRRTRGNGEHQAECAAGWARAVQPLQDAVKELSTSIKEHNRDAGLRHTAQIGLLSAIRENTRRG